MNTMSISIGGAYIRWGILDDDYNFILKDKEKSNLFIKEPIDVINRVAEITNKYISEYKLNNVSIQFPGITNEEGVVIDPPKRLSKWKRLNIIEEFNKICELKTKVIPQSIALTLNELKKGKLADVNLGVLLYIGSSIEGGVVFRNEIIFGHNSGAGQFGKQLIEGIPWEENASSWRLLNRLTLITGDTNIITSDISSIIKDNQNCFEEYDKWSYRIAQGINNIINIINPDVIILSGGITNNKDFSLDRIIKHLYRFTKDEILETTKIEVSDYKETGSLLGGKIDILN